MSRCAKDQLLLSNIEYDAQAITAYAETYVFKYADRVQLYFTCTLQLCLKTDGGCDDFTVYSTNDIVRNDSIFRRKLKRIPV